MDFYNKKAQIKRQLQINKHTRNDATARRASFVDIIRKSCTVHGNMKDWQASFINWLHRVSMI